MATHGSVFGAMLQEFEGAARILHEGFRWVGETHARPGPPPRLGEHTREVLDELQQKKSAASA